MTLERRVTPRGATIITHCEVDGCTKEATNFVITGWGMKINPSITDEPYSEIRCADHTPADAVSRCQCEAGIVNPDWKEVEEYVDLEYPCRYIASGKSEFPFTDPINRCRASARWTVDGWKLCSYHAPLAYGCKLDRQKQMDTAARTTGSIRRGI